MNCFYGMVDRRKAFSGISNWNHSQRYSPWRISDTPRAGFEPVQNLSSGLVEWSSPVVITTTSWRHYTTASCCYKLRCPHMFCPRATRSKTRKPWKHGEPQKFSSNFLIWPNTQNRNLGRRKLGKKISRFPRFLTFPTFVNFWFITF